MSAIAKRAVVFAYHDVGVRGLSVLLALGVDVRLVVTHDDDPAETIWFSSVAELAALNDIPVIAPPDPNAADVVERVRACQPDVLFSFYYRHMLGAELLQIPVIGAYNLHGSLLPKYRGRVPVNWAVLQGETETGASLHRMEIKPDAGALVGQQAVAILPNDTAHVVFRKVTCAAEQLLLRCVPLLLNGVAQETALDLSAGSYFGGRRPEDGRIDWHRPASTIHNLIRAVAPPYPGAFFIIKGTRLQVLGSYYRALPALGQAPRLYWQDGHCRADCVDKRRLELTALAIDGKALDERGFQARFGAAEVDLT
ncbi:MAG: formyltransferase [Gammaproteobacteria bacterium]|jgi:methionyl-tRNA formyltransferase|nr:formyltransferase [Gammaproteobacteria bacterium]